MKKVLLNGGFKEDHWRPSHQQGQLGVCPAGDKVEVETQTKIECCKKESSEAAVPMQVLHGTGQGKCFKYSSQSFRISNRIEPHHSNLL